MPIVERVRKFAMKHKVRRKKDLISKVKASYNRSKKSNLMVNPLYNIKHRMFSPVPEKFRTRLYTVVCAKESIGAANAGYFDVHLNGLAAPFSTLNPIPGTYISGTSINPATIHPLCYLDIIGDNTSTGLYDRYCVLNVKYRITYTTLGLNDTQYVVVVPLKYATTLTNINFADDYPHSSPPKFVSGYNTTSQNTITGSLNMAKFLGYSSDAQYAGDPYSTGTRTTNPDASLPDTKCNLVQLRVFRQGINSGTLVSPLAYKVEIQYDVEFRRTSKNLSE